MSNDLEKYREEVSSFEETSAEKIENFRIKYLGKKGILNELFTKFKSVPNKEKREFGQSLNILKEII